MEVKIDADELCALRRRANMKMGERDWWRDAEEGTRLRYSEECSRLKKENEELKNKSLTYHDEYWVSKFNWDGLVKERDWWRKQASVYASICDIFSNFHGSIYAHTLRDGAKARGYEVPE